MFERFYRLLLFVDLICCVNCLMYGTACTPLNTCPFKELCVNASQSVGLPEQICICRRVYENGISLSQTTWRQGYENCTDGYQPLSLSPYENGKQLFSPSYEYEALPAAQFSSNVLSSNPSFARLYQGFDWLGGPTATNDEYLQVDLGAVSLIKMIATQGRSKTLIQSVVLTYYVDYGVDLQDLDKNFNSNKRFFFNVPSNVGNDVVIYNFFNYYGINASIIKITPVSFAIKKSLRIELFGKKSLNECNFPSLNGCDKNNAVCTDTVAAYSCKCNEGSKDNSNNGFSCTLINECLETGNWQRCDPNAKCTDTRYGYNCNCMQGYDGDGFYCEDRNECLNASEIVNPKCSEYAFCRNIIGSYRCVCKAGFLGDGTKCSNINECRPGAENNCHKNADCKDNIGSYTCECQTGYTGDGFKCNDIDECMVEFPCFYNAECINTIGSYACKCPKGFEQSGVSCIDIDECKKVVCKQGELCFNTQGSFLCICPSVMPVIQQPFNTSYFDRKILDFLLFNFRDDLVGNYRLSLDYHAQKLRTIYYFLKNTFDFHSTIFKDPFFMSKTVGNYFSVELYNFRCTDIASLSFPNFCHSSYNKTLFFYNTDIVNISLIKEVTTPKDSWVTPEPYVLDNKLINGISSYNPIPSTGNSSYNYSTTTPSPVVPYGCSFSIQANLSQSGNFSCPIDEKTNKYRPLTTCTWTIVVSEPYNLYVNFIEDQFDIEYSKGCKYDYVSVKDENSKELQRYCGNKSTTYFLPVRSGSKIIVSFISDKTYQYSGFLAKWGVLSPRVSLGCLIYNQLATLPDQEYYKKHYNLDLDDKDEFVPVSRLIACYQYPNCKISQPGPIVYTFQHFREDRNDKKCIYWNLDSTATSYLENICIKVKTNKTHTICECQTFGIVAVVGRATVYLSNIKDNLFKLGLNCFYSCLLVTLSLLLATFYLFLKDQWGASAYEAIRMKEFDSGRVIQLHIMVNAFFTEIFFLVINFNVSGKTIKCHILVFIFYYFLQTVFFWLYIYALFLQSRVQEIFDSEKYNSYKIYLFVGYIVPLGVTLTISGLYFKLGSSQIQCWYLFEGTSVWGFSSVIITIAVVTLLLLVDVTLESKYLVDGIILQEKCMKTAFTTLFMLLTTIFGTLAIQTKLFSWQYLFSLCNLLQGFSIVILYCILKREDPIIKANQIGPKPDLGEDIEEAEDGGKFLDVSPCESESDADEIKMIDFKKPKELLGKKNLIVEVFSNNESQEAAVDKPGEEYFSSDENLDQNFKKIKY